MRPFAGSVYDPDESVGLVGRENALQWRLARTEIKEAEAQARAKEAQIKATYRQERSVQLHCKTLSQCKRRFYSERECKVNL